MPPALSDFWTGGRGVGGNGSGRRSLCLHAPRLRVRYPEEGVSPASAGSGRYAQAHGLPYRRALSDVHRRSLVCAMMMNEPGGGLQVRGELYEVDDPRLALLDRLESV